MGHYTVWLPFGIGLTIFCTTFYFRLAKSYRARANTYYGASFEFPPAYDFIRRYHDIWHADDPRQPICRAKSSYFSVARVLFAGDSGFWIVLARRWGYLLR